MSKLTLTVDAAEVFSALIREDGECEECKDVIPHMGQLRCAHHNNGHGNNLLVRPTDRKRCFLRKP